MSLQFAIGESQAPDGFEAAIQASRQALQNMGKASPTLGWVIASHNYPLEGLIGGINSQLGGLPILGFSTSAGFTSKGIFPRSVLIGLIAAHETHAVSGWWPDFDKVRGEDISHWLQSLDPAYSTNARLFLVADGINGDAAALCAALPQEDYPVIGTLASSESNSGRTFQLGGKAGGFGGLAAMMLSGNLEVSTGIGHGWQPTGVFARISQTRGPWIRSLDEHRAAETYAKYFGYSARQWAFPPLNHLVRLYPLGLDQGGSLPNSSPTIRSPLRVEADGSLRMHTIISEGQLAHLMISSQETCLQAAKRAADEALQKLQPARPALALVFTDIAWQSVFAGRPGVEIQAIQSVLGPEVPILGGYTYGQIASSLSGVPAELLNQHLLVVLLGEK